MKRTTLLGLFGVFGICITAGLALPMVNLLDMFSPTQLMVLRGFLTAAIAFVGLRGVIGRVDKYTYLIALILPLATLGLFQGIRHWGAGPTIIIVTATPLINLMIGVFTGRRISPASIIGFVLVIGGVVIARWGGHFDWAGFGWSVFATILNGALYELFARAKATSLQKCFYACMGMGTLGLVLSTNVSWAPIFEPINIALVLGFAFVGGFLYWVANLITFENLPTIEASVLVQAETPAVIFGAYVMLHEQISLVQGVGVLIALTGTSYLSYWLAKQDGQEQTSNS